MKKRDNVASLIKILMEMANYIDEKGVKTYSSSEDVTLSCMEFGYGFRALTSYLRDGIRTVAYLQEENFELKERLYFKSLELESSLNIDALDDEHQKDIKEYFAQLQAVEEQELNDNDEVEPEVEGVMATPIEALDLSVRAYNVLIRAGIKTVDDIMEKSPNELRCVRNMGRRSLGEIIYKMESLETGYLAKYGKTLDDMESITKGEEQQ